MAVEAALALYLAAKSLIFATRRADKTLNGDVGSALIAGAQLKNGLGAIASFDNKIGKAAGSCVNAIENTAKSKSLLGYAAKGLNVAVNPAIVGLGVFKVVNSDDKKTEAIKQGLSIGTMFTAEGIAKKFLTPEGRAILQEKGILNKNWFFKAMEGIDRYASKVGVSKWAKIGIPLAKAATFVCASVAGFSIGSKIASEINKARGAYLTENPYNINPAVAETEERIPVSVNEPVELADIEKPEITENPELSDYTDVNSDNKKIDYAA